MVVAQAVEVAGLLELANGGRQADVEEAALKVKELVAGMAEVFPHFLTALVSNCLTNCWKSYSGCFGLPPFQVWYSCRTGLSWPIEVAGYQCRRKIRPDLLRPNQNARLRFL